VAERSASTRAVTYDDAVRAEVTAVSTPKVPQTATGFYDATAVLGKKGAAEKGGKFPKEIRAKEIEARKPPGFQVKRNSAGPIQNQAELLVELMALEIERLNPERTIPRDDRGIVAVSGAQISLWRRTRAHQAPSWVRWGTKVCRFPQQSPDFSG
jgi:hypothetical protein